MPPIKPNKAEVIMGAKSIVMPYTNRYTEAVIACLNRYYPEFNWVSVQDGSHPESFADLKAAAARGGAIKINGVTDARNIFGSEYGNVLFRAWHDAVHLSLDADFSKQGEYAVAGKQMAELIQIGAPREVALDIYYDVVAQVEYYEKHKRFVVDQLKFTELRRSNGVQAAIKELI